ncbi:hypothetical protein MIMGU_mgv1a025199mg, partial [Erythranthe guttata]
REEKAREGKMKEEYYAECCKPHLHMEWKSDGCQEFMWESSSLECKICGCHRNFHRKVVVVYTKCHKVHDFKVLNSVDGCQEFIPNGKEGYPTALSCAVCGCHKGFHRNEVTIKPVK